MQATAVLDGRAAMSVAFDAEFGKECKGWG